MTTQNNDEKLNALVSNYGDDFPTDVTKIGEYYGKIGPELYDEYMKFINFNAEPYNIAPAVEEILNLPKDAKILDVGCGTGLIAKLISPKGYNNMYGVDATDKFVVAARETGLYKEAECMYLGNNVLPEKFTNTFDCVIASGVWLKGHIPCSGYDDVYSAMKVGSLFITAMRTKYYENGEEEHYKDALDKFIADGRLELTETRLFKRGINGGTSLMQEQDSILLVFKKL